MPTEAKPGLDILPLYGLNIIAYIQPDRSISVAT